MLSLTAQWVDEDFQQHQVLLRCQEMPRSNSTHDHGSCCISSKARNVTKALDESNLASLPCMAHTLQLAVNEGLLSQQSNINAVAGRKIIGHFKHSPLTYSRLHNIKKQLGQPTKRLQQDIPTRWNSTSLMEQRRALGAYAAEHELLATLNTHQWGLIE